VPKLTLLGLLSLQISFEEKAVTHPDIAYFAVREAQSNGPFVEVLHKILIFFLGHGVDFNKKRNEANFESTNLFPVCMRCGL